MKGSPCKRFTPCDRVVKAKRFTNCRSTSVSWGRIVDVAVLGA